MKRTALAATTALAAGALALTTVPAVAATDAPKGCASFDATLAQHLDSIGVDYTYIALNPDGTEKSRSHNMFSLTWTFKNGQWVVIADQNTKLPA